MPMYTVSTREPVAQQQREVLAKAIVDTHCGLTGAPAVFVHVIFSHSIALAPGNEVYLLANVRKGRSMETNNILENELAERLESILEVPKAQQQIVILEIPAQWIMEGGEVMPEPGEEASSRWG